MAEVNQAKFPNLVNRYSEQHENITFILSVLEKECNYLFNLSELEELANAGWDRENHYLQFFDACVKESGQGYTEEEIQAKLFPYLHKWANDSSQCRFNFSVPYPCSQEIGFFEKFQNDKLQPDLSRNNVLKNYAFKTLDMSRSAARKNQEGVKPIVLELRHLTHLNIDSLKNTPCYIRSTTGDKKGLDQWILLYFQGNTPYLYSESPVSEEDKKKLQTLYDKKEPVIEGGASALSMSSGIRAVAHFIEKYKGAGLSSSADYFSLLIEWVWFTSNTHPIAPNWNWNTFKQNVLRWDQYNHKFALLDFKNDNELNTEPADNEHMQMRSYYLGLTWALADTSLNALLIDPKESTVSLTISPELFNENKIEQAYLHNGYATKAVFDWYNNYLKKKTTRSNPSEETFAKTLVLNVFRGCAKEKNLTIDLPHKYQLDEDEKALVIYLMEMNPFVCDLKNPQSNASLTYINDNLQHIFARNRWLSLNDYLPPLLDEFWVVAAEYWVAFLKDSPDLLSERRDVEAFKRCVREMGLHGLIPFLNYLEDQESELKPAFNTLLQNVDKLPVFYAGCAPKDIKSYTKTLISHLQYKRYFPFKRFQLSFAPNVNQEIITLLTELNQLDIFDKISLTDCLASNESRAALAGFLQEAIDRTQQDPNWKCPIHIPELEKPLDDSSFSSIVELYSQLNNILIIRGRQKMADKLFEIPAFVQAAQVDAQAIAPGLVPGTHKEAQASTALIQKFNDAVEKKFKDTTLSLARAGGLSLQMQQQQQIKQERSRCLDNEMEKGMGFEDVLPSILIDYTNIDHELGTYYQSLNQEQPINNAKATLHGGSPLQNFFHTWVNANPNVSASHIIKKMTPYAAKTLLKYHRQLSGGLNVGNLPRGFYTQRLASGELILGYKSTLGYTTDHNPLTLQLTTALPQVERILGDYRQFKTVDENESFAFLQLLAQMQPELKPEEKENRYQDFGRNAYKFLNSAWLLFYLQNKEWVTKHWELFYTAHRSGLDKACLLTKLSEMMQSTTALSTEDTVDLLLKSIYQTSTRQRERIKNILKRQEGIDYAKTLGQIYSRYGDYGLERFSNLIITIENRLGSEFTDCFFNHYLKHGKTFSPLLQSRTLAAIEQMIAELAEQPEEARAFQAFLELHMQAVDWEDFSTLWKGFRYFYSHIKEMGLEQQFTPELLRAIKPRGQNLFPCFERILNSLEKIPNQALRKELILGLAHLDLTEGGVPYAVCHDGFVLVDESLQLTEFQDGAPTYKAPLEKLYQPNWKELYTLRALASQSHIKPDNYKAFAANALSKEMLIWAIHTEWNDAQTFLTFFNQKDSVFIEGVAHHFHRCFYLHHQVSRRFPLAMFESLQSHWTQLSNILDKYPTRTTFFDCYKRVYTLPEVQPQAVFDLFLNAPDNHPHLEQGLILTTVFRLKPSELDDFYKKTHHLKPITRNELLILTNQLMSVDLGSLPASSTLRNNIWTTILDGIAQMDKHPLMISGIRKELMQSLKNKHKLTFKCSVTGDYHLVTDEDLQGLGLEQLFEQHSGRLCQLLKRHLAISEAEKNEGPLKPLIEFFKRLQLNKTYINEVEPLLATLEKVLTRHPHGCWTAAFLNEFLRALQSQDDAAGFPMSVLEALLTEPGSPFIPVLIDEAAPHFDDEKKWQSTLSAILSKTETFNRTQQAQLARLALRCAQELEFIPQLVTQLAHQNFDGLRDAVLARLLAAKESVQYAVILKECSDLAHLNPTGLPPSIWKSTCHLWMDALLKHPALVQTLKDIERLNRPEKERILHIVAFSSFPSHRYPTVPRSNYFKGGNNKANKAKVIKLAECLADLSNEELATLAACYPAKPAPDTRDLLDFIKNRTKRPVKEALDLFLTEEQALLRYDYKQLSSIREFDLLRLLKSTYIIRGKDKVRIDSELGTKLIFMFRYLKQLEQGQSTTTSGKPIRRMTKEELRLEFKRCSKALSETPHHEQLQIQLLAVLFEALGRTTGKYPHLAQQFALIANDVLLADDPASILQLKTGEGKSHFIALRVARHAGMGKKVDVCTAKWSLAERDLLDYQPFFEYLDIKTANVHARSTRQTYVEAQVVYTTPGDLSLFLDEQASQGEPIVIEKDRRVGLGDEFDFLYYEGQKTQFNYARHTGITPKEMAWFYHGLNKFYDEKLNNQKNITAQTIQACFAFLAQHAPEDGHLYLENINPMTLLSWLQSAHEAASLQSGVNYTVRLEQVKIGEEEFPLHEIYPLTKDMQAAVGSTFSHGVHQLLAERLNAEEQKKGKAQDHHVHPESDIISSQVFSQRLKSLWGHWEGFTGTVSPSQALELQEEHKAAVLCVPTNQQDLRKWPEPQFFDNKAARLAQMVDDIKKKLAEKKSILLCCATDADVKRMDTALQKYFSPEEYNSHFLSYTNESHESPADILRHKTQMEGDHLGQKIHGVVLIAAGFGRGDNVNVEAVILNSVHDENDLGQKGGRTARNGAEGEVLQYYLIDEINNELQALHAILQKNPELNREVKQELTEKKHLMASFFNEPPLSELKEFEPALKFNLLLGLKEFLAAQDNYPSLVYHEAKAVISSEGIRLIGKADVEQKERLIKGFATYLSELEKTWMAIQTTNADTNNRMEALYQSINNSLKANGKLTHLFKETGEISFAPNAPKKPQFLLDSPLSKVTADADLMTAAQSLLLKVDKLPEKTSHWNQLIKLMSSLNSVQLTALLSIYREHQLISLESFSSHLDALDKPHNVVDDLNTLQQKKLKLSKLKLSPSLQHALIAMPSEASNAAWSYLLTPGMDDLKERIEKAAPLLLFSTGNAESPSYWEPATRDELLSLPSECLDKPIVPVDSGILLGIKNFLDRFVSVKDASRYASLFRTFLQGMQNQPEQRKRLLTHYEVILSCCTPASQPQILEQLAQLGMVLKNSDHGMILKALIEKMSAEYENPRVALEELNRLWGDLLKPGDHLSDRLPLIEYHLASEGKEFFPVLHFICQLEPNLFNASQKFLKALFSHDSINTSKKEKIKAYEKTVQAMQEVFINQKPEFLTKTFTCFNDLLTSKSFLNLPDKKSAFEGLRELIAMGMNTEGLVELNQMLQIYSKKQLHALLHLCYRLPKHATAFLSLDSLVRYASLGSGLTDEEAKAVQILLEKAVASNKIDLEELNRQLESFDSPDKMLSLFYLCRRFPERTVDLILLEPAVSFFHSKYYFALTQNQQRNLVTGLKVLMDKKPIKSDQLNALTDEQKEKLFFLFKSFPNFVTKTSGTDFLPWVNYLCSEAYKALPEKTKEACFDGMNYLLKKGKTIFDKTQGIAQFSQPEDMTDLLILAEKHPKHANNLLAFKPLIVFDNAIERKDIGTFLEDNNLWVKKNLMSMDSERRIHFMTFLKNGDFIGPKLSEKTNSCLFQTGLASYKHHIQDVLKPQANAESRYRSLSRTQQARIKETMQEFERIGKADLTVPSSDSKARLGGNIKAQIEAYKKLKWKNDKRYQAFSRYIEALSDSQLLTNNNHSELLVYIRNIKQDLIQYDMNIAYLQWIPRLHFRGRSRLYRTLNEIEDLVLKSWVEDARQQSVSAEDFLQNHETTRDSHIEAFKAALAQWDRKRPLFFKSTTLTLSRQIHGKDNNETVDFLNAHPKLVNNLPGILKAIAHEVLAHDARATDENNRMIAGYELCSHRN